MSIHRASVAFFLGLLTSSCGAPSASQEVFLHNREINIVGRIDQVASDYILNADPADYDGVVVTSQGGHISSAIKIAERLNRDNKYVVAREVCISACASIIFVGTVNRYATKGAFIAFHGTQTGIVTMYRAAKQRFPEISLQKMAFELAERESLLYESAGVRKEVLLLPVFARGGVCFFKEAGKNREFAPSSEYSSFRISLKQFENLGVRVLLDNGGTGINGAPRRAISARLNQDLASRIPEFSGIDLDEVAIRAQSLRLFPCTS